MKKFSWLALGAALAFATAASAQSVTNPGFESGDLSGWSTFGLGWRIGTGDDAHDGTYGFVCDILDTHVGEEWRGVYQSVSVTGGETYDAGVWIRSVSVSSSASWFELQWLDSGGSPISQLQSSSVTADQAFTYMGLTGAVAPLNAVSASIRGIVHMESLPASGDSDFHIFDDFSIVPQSAIPEPGTLFLIATGAIGLVARRRKQR